jgi:hypothetical protein
MYSRYFGGMFNPANANPVQITPTTSSAKFELTLNPSGPQTVSSQVLGYDAFWTDTATSPEETLQAGVEAYLSCDATSAYCRWHVHPFITFWSSDVNHVVDAVGLEYPFDAQYQQTFTVSYSTSSGFPAITLLAENGYSYKITVESAPQVMPGMRFREYVGGVVTPAQTWSAGSRARVAGLKINGNVRSGDLEFQSLCPSTVCCTAQSCSFQYGRKITEGSTFLAELGSNCLFEETGAEC